MADLEKQIDNARRLIAPRKPERKPALFEIKGKFYHAKSGKPVKVAPVKPTFVRPSGVSRDMWTWVEKGGRAWSGRDPRGKERTPGQRYYDWVARGGLKRAERAKQAMGGKRRHSDSDVVDVMFRVVRSGEGKGEVEAWFPGLPGTNQYDMTMYAHVGQHGSGDPQYMRERTRPAKPSEYADLKRELQSIGYKLRIVKRATQRHFAQRKEAMIH